MIGGDQSVLEPVCLCEVRVATLIAGERVQCKWSPNARPQDGLNDTNETTTRHVADIFGGWAHHHQRALVAHDVEIFNVTQPWVLTLCRHDGVAEQTFLLRAE